MKILVLNSGSSSIKYQLFDMPSEKVLAKGLIEKIGEKESEIKQKTFKGPDILEVNSIDHIVDHHAGLNKIAALLLDQSSSAISNAGDIEAVGHRVVHGGEDFNKPTIIGQKELGKLKELSFLAPLHNPANLEGIEVAQKVFPNSTQVAVFDTAFHQTIPEFAFRFAIPESFYKKEGLRVYGFHGTSHQYVSRQAADYLKIPLEKFNAISIHLGNGCSMTAIKNGQSVDTSMGLTPMGGLIMGTRSGDIDPSLILFMANTLKMKLDQIDHILNKESGLKGLTGDNDLRNLLSRCEQNDHAALLAIEMYVYRIKKYIGAYAASLGRIDTIIFTAGVGENSVLIREKVCENMQILGIEIDPHVNSNASVGVCQLQAPGSIVNILVVPTNEELEIANQTVDLLK